MSVFYKHMSSKSIITNIKVYGIVQGVGFRPFIHRLVTDYSLTGWIRNTFYGAELEVEGIREDILNFLKDIRIKAPKLAVIEKIEAEEILDKFMQEKEETYEFRKYKEFKIIESAGSESRDTLISPDICICDDCLREMLDPDNRRYKYPFINCTNCGPRFTIIKDIPYDRDKTTMADFNMCDDCYCEYTNIENRRYHAEPVCCPDCGPRLFLLDGDGKKKNNLNGDNQTEPDNNIKNIEAIKAAQKLLESGKIVAVKGIGGIHLACLYDKPETAFELRKRKERDEKPFALMVKDVETARRLCHVSEEEEKILTGFRRPIVLLKKRDTKAFKHLSENNYIGIMLPYTPVHYLLFDGASYDGLIMTSANLSDRPIMYKNEEAIENLKGIADAFLLNDREIETRCDDSLTWVFEGGEYFARRSRGYVPFPIKCLKTSHILACGAEQKASFALGKDEYIFPSQHIGDLKNAEALENYEKQIRHFEKMFSIKPEIIVCDLHPDYLSTEYAEARAKKEGLKLVRVQHHHAHMASCMADNGLNEPCIGIIWDGTGLGGQESDLICANSDECCDNKRDEALIWGGEFLVGDYSGFKRAGTIKPFRLPGGDKAAKEIWRCGLSLIHECDTSEKFNEYNTEDNHYAKHNTNNNRTQAYKSDNKGISCCRNQNKQNTGKEGKYNSLLWGQFTEEQIKAVGIMLEKNINSPYCTSMGRLFDGVASMLGIKENASYEGQGAVLLETSALDNVTEVFPYRITKEDKYYFDYSEMIAAIFEIMKKNRSQKEFSEENFCSKDSICMGHTTDEAVLDDCAIIRTASKVPDDDIVGRAAAMFMNTLVDMAVEMSKLIRKDTGLNKIVLSGGTFQNQYMLKRLCENLKAEDFEVYHHRKVSANDEGIALGQAAVAAHRINII